MPEYGGLEDDDDLIRKATSAASRNAAAAFGADTMTFADLWEARPEPLGKRWPDGGGRPYDASSADMALAVRLAFWTGKNCERMERLMRRSALARGKWDSHRTYLADTIMKACAYDTAVYSAGKQPGFSEPEKPSVDGLTWPTADITVIEGSQDAPPPFPVHLLGPYWGPWCETAARGANAPVDYTAIALLTFAAALIGNSRTAAASPTWREPAVLWSVLVGVPSSGKSPAVDPLLQIIRLFEVTMAKGFEAAAILHASTAEEAKQRRDQWQGRVKDAIKLNEAPPAMPAGAVEPEPLQRPRILISDVTLESTAEIAAANPKGLVLYRDELGGWWRGFNRYGGDGERAFWLECYGARPYTVDRKKAGRPVTVERLAISILGGAQPDVLADMLRSEADGFSARFIYAFPRPVDGFRLSTSPVDIEGAHRALAHLHDLNFVDSGAGNLLPFACRLTEDGAQVFERWWSDRRTWASQETGVWGGWLGKLGGQALRIALVLEHLRWCHDNSADSATAHPTALTAQAINSAISLIDDWAVPMARRAFGVTAMSPQENDMASLARWLKRSGSRTFNARKIRRESSGPGGRLSEAAHMDAACKRLEEAGLLQTIGRREGPTQGRSKKDYAVNPILWREP